MLRLIYFYILLLPLTIFYSLVIIFSKTQKNFHWSERSWGKAVLDASGCEFDVDLSALDKNQTYVFMVNHQSFFDIPLLFHFLSPWQFKFVAKKSLFNFPIFGHAMAAAKHISIDRDNSRQGMKDIQHAVEVANSGHSPLIFPEGTRNPDPNKLLPFKIGGMILALKCQKPIAPILMVGPEKVLYKGKLIMSPCQKIRIKALPPIDTTKYTLKDREKIKEDLQEIMNKAYAEMRHE
ncbi:1-acyl-sn-glycerol-3-phosphate acyltransferase [Maridesulfovibrio ferrireducens]|uniref:1-acyl-sn-glycerol-3-phosphate acyltransferase n=1 Tax=Maridesulfovibrio ferrireducens TaxID=246191 RepID=A0A1G9GUW1_9BACT|nr:lysophospholipid acyltransferase family protein [Maridesulfovibrio ferrireducens]SDL04461.1 1-acyl-sn-glycerol-3-phosphate acyltransferase [Maridesulfovibrio ferrireducens]